jgi:hypothetical protein
MIAALAMEVTDHDRYLICIVYSNEQMMEESKGLFRKIEGIKFYSKVPDEEELNKPGAKGKIVVLILDEADDNLLDQKQALDLQKLCLGSSLSIRCLFISATGNVKGLAVDDEVYREAFGVKKPPPIIDLSLIKEAGQNKSRAISLNKQQFWDFIEQHQPTGPVLLYV